MDNLLETARRAWRDVAFYRELYGVEPADNAHVPFISASSYHRADGIIDCVHDHLEIVSVLPPRRRYHRRFPFTVVEDEGEQCRRQGRVRRALGDIGVDAASHCCVLIVADADTGPFACELSKTLIWERHQACIAYDAGDTDDLQRTIDAHAPDYVIPLTGGGLDACRRTGATLLLAAHTDLPLPCDTAAAVWLFCDEAYLLGSRPAGRRGYDVDPEQLLLEPHPESALTHLTTLAYTCFPLIRYGLDATVPLLAETVGETDDER